MHVTAWLTKNGIKRQKSSSLLSWCSNPLVVFHQQNPRTVHWRQRGGGTLVHVARETPTDCSALHTYFSFIHTAQYPKQCTARQGVQAEERGRFQ